MAGNSVPGSKQRFHRVTFDEYLSMSLTERLAYVSAAASDDKDLPLFSSGWRTDEAAPQPIPGD